MPFNPGDVGHQEERTQKNWWVNIAEVYGLTTIRTTVVLRGLLENGVNSFYKKYRHYNHLT